MSAAFYRRAGNGYAPTDYVTGPWDPNLCHAGPPAALVLHSIASSLDGMGVTRSTFEIPRGIPKVPCRVELTDVRPGAKIRLVRADLVAEDGSSLMVAHAWCIRTTEGGLPTSDPFRNDLPRPDDCPPMTLTFGDGLGYMDGVEMRAAAGKPFVGGPAAIWIRPRIPLIEGITEHPVSRFGLFGDLGNGISAIEPFSTLLAINTDLTVYIAREPSDGWIGMHSTTISHGLGLGMTDSLLYDASGFVGKANQSVFFDRR